jgi:polyhydroxybutyrate depolymerase
MHLAIVAAIVLASSPNNIYVAVPKTMHWTIDGVDRQALVFLPAVSSPHPPVVIAFHGHGGSAASAAESMRFQHAWREAIIVYPQGVPTKTPRDPEGARPGWQRDAGQYGDRDLKFFDAMRSEFRADRIYVVGFSNGGALAYLLWAQRPDALAGVAICASLPGPAVHPTKPRPVIHIAGEIDHVAEFAQQLKVMDEEKRINATAAPAVRVIHPRGHMFPPGATERIVKFFRTGS